MPGHDARERGSRGWRGRTWSSSAGRARDGKTRQMRMVFTDITPQSILWRWEATVDGGKTWSPMLVIEYRRRSS